MTLEQLDASLPNGFHDARFRSLVIDYGRMSVAIAASILVGSPDEAPGLRSRMREAVVVIDGLEFVSIEPPKTTRDYKPGRPLWVELLDRKSSQGLRMKIPDDCFVGEFFVRDWNSTIQVVGRSAHLTWEDQGEESPRP